ncbi:Fanconi anemia group E protein [Hoplias malabaricus]|uniref:Fanconi anemia group E protein n=1 Tax=Hoplias malabaricus TaxID=27720 RepID=UPI003462E51D
MSFLNRFNGPSRLLTHALLTGGVNEARKVFFKLRAANPTLCLRTFLQTFSEDEVWLEKGTQSLTRKPLVCLFSDAFKCNLLCFLHIVHPWLPQDSVLALLQCLSQEVKHKSWVWTLIHQLRRDIGDRKLGANTLLSTECLVRLKGLCEKFKDPQAGGGWEVYLNEPRTEVLEDNEKGSDRKKRKGDDVNIDTDVDEPKTKRMKLDLTPREDSESENMVVDEEDLGIQLYNGPSGFSPAGQHPLPEGSQCLLPEHVKVAVPLIKEFLQSETEWNESCRSTLKVLNECDSKQLELLCGILHLSELPEQTLSHFCSFLLSLSPDLSHSTACVIVKNLLLEKVLSLSETASRSLVTAVTSLCSRYPRPTCQVLIEPIIKEGKTGAAQAELLCGLVKECLEPHYRLLVFEMTLVGSWNEALLSVIHALLDSKIELSEEVFSLFTNQVSSQSPHFTKSMKFAKMMLTALTKFHSLVNSSCQHTLSSCISLNETFLKKSLQAALKRVSH